MKESFEEIKDIAPCIQEIPLMFKPYLTKSILSGLKDMTRRVISERNSCCTSRFDDLNFKDVVIDDFFSPNKEQYLKVARQEDDTRHRLFCKYYVNDLMWVKEKWCESCTESGAPVFGYAIDNKANYIGKNDEYLAPSNELWSVDSFPACGRWKSPMFMKKVAARLWLKITSIKVEKLNDITDEDCMKEGICKMTKDDTVFKYAPLEQWQWADMPRTPKDAFKKLWEEINGMGSWDINPWVWAIQFEIDKQKSHI